MCEPVKVATIGVKTLEPVHERLVAERAVVAGVEQFERAESVRDGLASLGEIEQALVECCFGLPKGSSFCVNGASPPADLLLMDPEAVTAWVEEVVDHLRAACGVGR